MLRILCAADVPSDPNSGAAGTEYQTIRALRALGHEVDEIWADDLPHRVRHGNLHYLLELPKGYRDAIRGKWETHTYDVVHVNQPHAYLAARDHQKAKRPGVFVNRSHGLELRAQEALAPWRRKLGVAEWRFPRGLAGRVVQALLARHSHRVAKHADGTIVYCSECKDFLVRRQGVAADRVAAIAAAPPQAFLTDAPAPMSGRRLSRLLYVSQFAFFKGPMVLARAVDQIMARNGRCELTWVCHEADHDHARQLLSSSALRRTRLLHWQDQNRLMHIYDSHGVFVFPSFYEGFGKVFIEAMARGLCVVASNTGGMRDVITDGRDGCLVPVGDSDALASKVLALMESPDQACAMAERARETASAYTWERVARETLEFYEHLLALKTGS